MDINIECTGADAFPISKITEFQGNLKDLPEENYQKLKKAITTLGFSSPIHIWRESDEHYILDGHQRLRALQRMQEEGYNIPDIPIVWVDAPDLKTAKKKVLSLTSQFGTLSDKSVTAFIAEAGLDPMEVREFSVLMNVDINKVVEKLLPKDEEEKEDKAPAPPRIPKSRPGDIFILGDHRLMCGDCVEIDDVEKLMQGDQADLVVTDPPYNVDYQGGTEEKLKIENDKMSDADFRTFLYLVYQNYFKVSRDGCPIYVFHADSEGFNFRSTFVEAGWKFAQCLIWVKDRLVLGRQDYHWQHEPILYGWKGDDHLYKDSEDNTTVIQFDRPMKNAEHPTMKPVDLISRLVKKSSEEGDVVIDFFGGSGSLLISCEETNRKCRTLEIDPRYVDVIINRWAKLTNKDPYRLNNDGSQTPWSEINDGS